MKRFLIGIIAIISFGFMTNLVSAAEITDASYENSQINVSGTSTGDIVQIVLFDPSNEPAYLTTDDVVDGVFDYIFPSLSGLVAGTYTIRVADYDGTNVDSATFTIGQAPGFPDTASQNNSLDIILVVLAAMSVFMIPAGIYFVKHHYK